MYRTPSWTKNIKERGGIIIPVIAFATISILILSGFVGWATGSVRLARKSEYRERALQIAEAGIDYYRWHLAHAPTDYKDGTGVAGPYVHPFYDDQGVKVGQFSLGIVAPPLGSTLVTVTSTGTVDIDPKVKRVIQAKFAKPSFAKYAALSNSLIQFGGGTEVWGPVHANGGLAFYGIAMHNLVTSALTTYLDPTTGNTEWAVHQFTPQDALPPGAWLGTTTGKFPAGRNLGVPAVDFAGITVDLTAMKALAAADGTDYGASGSGLGYHVVLQVNDTFDLYRVDTLVAQPGGCNVAIRYQNASDANCTAVAPNSMWSINTQTLIGNDVPFPPNGIMFFGDHVWIDGTINTARITVVAATIPATAKNIIVNNDLRYTDKVLGNDVIGLIAQNDVLIGFNSLDTLEVDAAIIAQNGRLHRLNYGSACGAAYQRNTVNFFGMFATAQRYALSTSGGSCPSNPSSSGYSTRDFTYDTNLLYGPPPSFPLTADQYQIISWDEQ